MSVLKTGRKCKWDDIKVGEVFAFEGCWQIFYKSGKNTALFLADDIVDARTHSFGPCSGYNFNPVLEKTHPDLFQLGVFKLPKSVQQLWKCE